MRLASVFVVFILLRNNISCELLEDNILTRLFEFDGFHSGKIKPSKLCSHDKREEMTTIDFIKGCGYPAEEHEVTTEDGYILTLHRIPGKKNSTPVLLHHGILESSFDWIFSGCHKALAYALHDNGYDVWLANARGNTYSRKHSNSSIASWDYWNFSWHEVGIYDLPANLNYITRATNTASIHYIGHSMGTTTFFVMSSERPNMASKVRAMFALAPIAFVGDIEGMFSQGAMLLHQMVVENGINGHVEFFSQNPLIKYIAKCVCNTPIFARQCAGAIFSIIGTDFKQLNTTLLPLILTHTPAGTSLKSFIHYAQSVVTKEFRHYDYGKQNNLKLYKSIKPPKYNLTRVTSPTALIWGPNDLLTPTINLNKLSRELPNKIGIFKVDYPDFNHLDFLFALDAPKLVYKRILNFMKKF